MDDLYDKYVEHLVKECLRGAKMAYLSQKEKVELTTKLHQHFNTLTINTLIDQLTEDQIVQIKAINPDSPEMEVKLTEFATTTPNFAQTLETVLKKELDQILQTGQIPEG